MSISNAAYSADCAAFRDGSRFEPVYVGETAVRQSPGPLLPAELMHRRQLAHEPEMSRYLIRSHHAHYRIRRRRRSLS